MKKSKIIFLFLGIIFILIVGMIYGAIFGLPWKKVYVGNEILKHIEEKYDETFVIEERIYNFKDGHYGIIVHPESDKSLSFIAEQGYGNYEFVDYYAEKVWEQQVKQEYEELVKELFPDSTELDAMSVMGIGVEIVKDGKVPNYKEVNETFSLTVRFNKEFDEDEKRYENAYKLIQKIQQEEGKMELSLIFEEKEEEQGKPQLEGYLNFTEAEMKIIKSIEDVKEYAKKDIY